MDLEYRTLPVELKLIACQAPAGAGSGAGGDVTDGTWQFEGLAAAFHNIDDSLFGDIIAPGAFVQDLPAFLAFLEASADADNAPQKIFVSLNVLAVGSSPAPYLLPASFLFTGAAGSV